MTSVSRFAWVSCGAAAATLLAAAWVVRAQDSQTTTHATAAQQVMSSAAVADLPLWPFNTCRTTGLVPPPQMVVPISGGLTIWYQTLTGYATTGCHLAVRDYRFVTPNAPAARARLEIVDPSSAPDTEAECEAYRAEAHLYAKPAGYPLSAYTHVAGGHTSGVWHPGSAAITRGEQPSPAYCERHRSAAYGELITALREHPGGQDYRLVGGVRVSSTWKPVKTRAVWSYTGGSFPSLFSGQL